MINVRCAIDKQFHVENYLNKKVAMIVRSDVATSSKCNLLRCVPSATPFHRGLGNSALFSFNFIEFDTCRIYEFWKSLNPER